MDYNYSSQYTFFQKIKGAISGNSYIIQDIKANKSLKEAVASYGLSAGLIVLIYSLISYLRFTLLNKPENILKLFEGYEIEESVQTLVIAAFSEQRFVSVLLGESSVILTLIVGLAVCWVLFSSIFHLFAKGAKGQASFVEFFVFCSYLLPLLALFSLSTLLFSIAGFTQRWYLIPMSIILAIIFFIILLRALVLGISRIYNLSKGQAGLICLIGFVILALLLFAVGLLIIPSNMMLI